MDRLTSFGDQVKGGLQEHWQGNLEAFLHQGQCGHRLGGLTCDSHLRRSIWYSSSATVSSPALVNSGAVCAAFGNCGWLVSFWTFSSLGVEHPLPISNMMLKDRVVDKIKLLFKPLLGLGFTVCISNRLKQPFKGWNGLDDPKDGLNPGRTSPRPLETSSSAI